MLVSQARVLTVRNIGRLEVDDIVQLGLDDTRQLRVVEVLSDTRVSLVNEGIAQFTVAIGERLVPLLAEPYLYKDSRAKDVLSTSGTTTVDANGYVYFYCTEARVDLFVSGSGVSAQMRLDIDGGWRRGGISWLNAADFNSIQGAIDALPQGVGGVVYLAEGIWTLSETLVVPLGIRVHLKGAGRERTTLKWTNAALDMLHVHADDVMLEGITFLGPGTASSSETAGRGVVVGNLAAVGATSVMRGFSMIDCAVRDASSWALWLVGADESGADSQLSLSILGNFERTYFESNKAFGLARLGRACTTQVFRSCYFLGAVGYSLLGHLAAQITCDACVFEASDDSKPYVRLDGAYGSALLQCWFEHHGGFGSARDSNTQYFVEITGNNRGVRIESGHFVRNAATQIAFDPTNPKAIKIGEPASVSTTSARGVVIAGCDFEMPAALSVINRDHIIVFSQSEVLVGSCHVRDGAGAIFPVALDDLPGADGKGSASTMLFDPRLRIRLPRLTTTQRTGAQSIEPWKDGDMTFDVDEQKVYVRASGSWRALW